MIKKHTALLAAAALLAVGASHAAPPLHTDNMGLSKTSVFDVPTPKVYHYSDAAPGTGKLLPRAYPGAPPQVPHDVKDYMPVTAESNLCIACHAQPDLWGKKPEAGVATAIPPSHYTDLRHEPGKVTDHLINARYNCNQCHVPQTDAPALVENTFSSKKTR
ncbi:MAG: nitrate reductase cytochrome c-type subunit [Gallionella sp.]|nr:nitrate reductase cytochrome c-type subunit [Gallionella sp.]